MIMIITLSTIDINYYLVILQGKLNHVNLLTVVDQKEGGQVSRIKMFSIAADVRRTEESCSFFQSSIFTSPYDLQLLLLPALGVLFMSYQVCRGTWSLVGGPLRNGQTDSLWEGLQN